MTLQDVAKLAGVAPITASRAINKPDSVSSEVLKKVQAAVERTGYVPNRMAGSLASSRSRMIAAIVPSTVMSVFMQTVETLNNTLFDAGYQLMLGQSSYSVEREEALLEAVIGRRPDGIFLAGILQPGRARTRLMASGIPVVESWDLTQTPIDMLIGFSHLEIGRAVAKHLIDKGRKHFAIVLAGDERADRRATAFQQVARAQGLGEVFTVNVGDSRTLRSGRDSFIKILQGAPQTDAIFCSSDLLAMGVVTEAKARGIHVPKTLSVMGFGDVPFGADMEPALSTVRINGGDIGRMAAERLIDRAEGRKVDKPIVDVGFSIVARGSA
ncbi:MAG: LacI family DNA-binding transcriptional regulator [Cytophagales bacterium]|nr:LacI family DNA-binding transcriptional regulator [Cytophagales bacterium]